MRRPLSSSLLLAVALLGWLLMPACGGGGRRVSSPQPHTHSHSQPLAPMAGEPPELIGVWYTVSRGDLLSAIAQRHEVPIEDLIELNGIDNPNQLEVGQDLFIYGVDKLVKRLAAKAPKRPKKRPAPRGKGKSRFKWPVKGARLSSGYGPRWGRMHRGVDFAAKSGTPIYAAAAGTVIYSNNKQRGYGNLILIQHPDQFVTVYAHNRRNLVDEGDEVRQGQRIGEVGSTGRSTGPHLHFEVRVKGKAVDPMAYLPAR
ncbi:MAG: LysM peptidoglycan-binding domain-containing M23 family metallopeptidase [Bradymonadia bacterium]